MATGMHQERETADGRLPPQDLEAERSVLGAMLLSDVAATECAEVLRPEDFYRTGHAEIFRAIVGLSRRAEPIDHVTVGNALAERGTLEEVGGRVELAALADAVPVVANAVHYARIVRDTSILRSLIRAGEQIVRLGYDRRGEPRELLDRAGQLVYELSKDEGGNDFSVIRDLLHETFEQIAAMSERDDGTGVTGVPTGYRDLDSLTAGLQKGNLVILAARPSMGKTSLALNIGEHVAVRLQRPVAVFSLEMSRIEIAQRLICSVGTVDQSRLRTGQLSSDDWARVTGAVDTLSDAPLYIDDSSSSGVLEIRAKCRRLAQRHGLAMIIVDYIQLMTSHSNFESRVQEVSQISRQLKLLARDLEVPVVALSQLSRAVEQRQDKRPILSDLRESGSIEQDADVVAFIYREAYYRRGEGDEAPMAPDDPDHNLTEIIVAKHRNGPVGSVKLRYQNRFTRFHDDYAGSRGAAQ